MHAINALLSGVKGAENGYAYLYKRETSTLATYYTDYKGNGSTVTPSTGIALDSNGGVVCFVNENVRVKVVDSSGTTVREWVEMVGAPVAEVTSQSFTGTHYDTLASAASNPVDLETVLNLWKTNAGAIDWKVLLDGSATTLQTAFGRLTGPAFYNVKDPTYGALGDNSNDDTAEIQAAIDAAEADTYGGLVYLPPGTYRITAALTMASNVSLVGAGVGQTTITIDHASNDVLQLTGSDGTAQHVANLNLTASQANSGNMLDIQARVDVSFYRVGFGHSSNADGDLVTISNTSTHKITFRDCIFAWGAATNGAINCAGDAQRIQFFGCEFIPPAACSSTNGWIYGYGIDLIGCKFRTDVCTSGTCSVYKSSSTTLDATITGCKFETSGGATVTGIELGTYVAASKFMESGNIAPGEEDTNFTLYSYTWTYAQQGADVQLKTREGRVQYLSSNDTTDTYDADQYGIYMVNRTGTANLTVTVTNNAPEGARATITIVHGGGASAPTFTINTLYGDTSHTITNGKYSAYVLQMHATSSNNQFLALSVHEDRTL